MKSSHRIVYARAIFITGIVLLTSLSVLFIYETQQETSSLSIADDTNLVVKSLDDVFLSLKERESSIRGYALSFDKKYLRESMNANQAGLKLLKMDSLLKNKRELLSQYHTVQDRFHACDQRLTKIESKMENREYLRSQAFIDDMDEAASHLADFKAVADQLKHTSNEISRESSLNAQEHTIVATIIGVGVSLFSMIIFILAFYFIDQELKRSQNFINESETLTKKIAEINAELEHANTNLSQLNAELAGKNFQLEKYATELSSFTRITSHDMQEPLRKIEFYTSIVEDREKEQLSEDGKRYLDKIKQSVSRMRKLFVSMLDFSLTNTVDNTVEDVDLNGVLTQTLQSLKVYIKDTNANIEFDHLPTVKGIRYQLIQLFENIISNAIKFRRPDVVPEIHITHEIVQADHYDFGGLKRDMKYFKIDFKDNGIGFDPRFAEKIFEIFQRLITKSESYGVGMGLAICRKIAENHGGILLAESEPDKGSVFSLYIPVTEPKLLTEEKHLELI
jgi:signal transduction histidine kinase